MLLCSPDVVFDKGPSLEPLIAALIGTGWALLIDGLGSQAVAGMLLGKLDVVVEKGLGLKPLLTALIGTGERTQASVIHHMILESLDHGAWQPGWVRV